MVAILNQRLQKIVEKGDVSLNDTELSQVQDALEVTLALFEKDDPVLSGMGIRWDLLKQQILGEKQVRIRFNTNLDDGKSEVLVKHSPTKKVQAMVPGVLRKRSQSF